MTFDERVTWVKQLWPDANTEQAENLVLHSSYHEFDGSGETLFRQGDPPSGFYWLLSGSVRQFTAHQTIIYLESGAMVGLEEFLQFRLHSFNWHNVSPAKALFLDRKCFELVVGSITDHYFIYHQLARQLMDLKVKYKVENLSAG